MVRRIIRLERKGVSYEIGGQWIDGYIIAAIDFRQQGLNGINNVVNAGAQPSYVVVLANPISDKDKKFVVIPHDVDAITFVEEDPPKQDNSPELQKVD